MRGLASGPTPLVTVETGPPVPEADFRIARMSITSGRTRSMLACRADHVALNGIDCWRGGIHLAGAKQSPWRWDARAETLVS